MRFLKHTVNKSASYSTPFNVLLEPNETKIDFSHGSLLVLSHTESFSYICEAFEIPPRGFGIIAGSIFVVI